MMNLNDVLSQMDKSKDWRLAQYFRWKHDIKYDQTREKRTEEDFLRNVNRKTMNSFIQFERTTEYKQLLILLLESQIAEDMQEIYSKVTEDAKSGDDKAVRLFIALQKEITNTAKLAKQTFVNQEDDDSDDDLILD